jgi:malonate-semialdehyde dehydrogenase (acetylating)/methylmalonate-semialdehyde dehydrogenase
MQLLSKLQRFSFAAPRVYENFYDGKFVPSKSTQFFEVYNPVTQEHVARSPQSSQEEFNAIVANAKEAYKTWSKVPLLSIALS